MDEQLVDLREEFEKLLGEAPSIDPSIAQAEKDFHRLIARKVAKEVERVQGQLDTVKSVVIDGLVSPSTKKVIDECESWLDKTSKLGGQEFQNIVDAARVAERFLDASKDLDTADALILLIVKKMFWAPALEVVINAASVASQNHQPWADGFFYHRSRAYYHNSTVEAVYPDLVPIVSNYFRDVDRYERRRVTESILVRGNRNLELLYGDPPIGLYSGCVPQEKDNGGFAKQEGAILVQVDQKFGFSSKVVILKDVSGRYGNMTSWIGKFFDLNLMDESTEVPSYGPFGTFTEFIRRMRAAIAECREAHRIEEKTEGELEDTEESGEGS